MESDSEVGIAGKNAVDKVECPAFGLVGRPAGLLGEAFTATGNRSAPNRFQGL